MLLAFSEFGSINVRYRAHAALGKTIVDPVKEVKSRQVFKLAAWFDNLLRRSPLKVMEIPVVN